MRLKQLDCPMGAYQESDGSEVKGCSSRGAFTPIINTGIEVWARHFMQISASLSARVPMGFSLPARGSGGREEGG
jgi:hypothetical protein